MPPLKNHILVPIDFSDQSIVALGQAQSLARISRASMTLIHVVESHMSMPFFRSSAAEKKSMEKKIQAELQKLAKGVTEKTGSKTEVLIVHGATVALRAARLPARHRDRRTSSALPGPARLPAR